MSVIVLAVTPSSATVLTAEEEGVYTCRMPFQTGSSETVDINVGIYRNGFNSE